MKNLSYNRDNSNSQSLLTSLCPSVLLSICRQENGGVILLLLCIAEKTMTAPDNNPTTPKISKELFLQWMQGEKDAAVECRERLFSNDVGIAQRKLVQGGTMLGNVDHVKWKAFLSVHKGVRNGTVEWCGPNEIHRYFKSAVEFACKHEMRQQWDKHTVGGKPAVHIPLSHPPNPDHDDDMEDFVCDPGVIDPVMNRQEISSAVYQLSAYMESLSGRAEKAFAYACILSIKKSLFFQSKCDVFISEKKIGNNFRYTQIEPQPMTLDSVDLKRLLNPMNNPEVKNDGFEKELQFERLNIHLSGDVEKTIEAHEKGWIIWDWGAFQIFPIRKIDNQLFVYNDAFTMTIESLLEDIDDPKVELDWEFMRRILGVLDKEKFEGTKEQNSRFYTDNTRFKEKFETFKEGQ